MGADSTSARTVFKDIPVVARNKHFDYCIDIETVRTDMPEENSSIRFYHGQNQFKVPFIIFIDFEAIFQKLPQPTPNPQNSYTTEINCHISSGFCTYSTFMYGEVIDSLRQYRVEDCVEVFCNQIEEEVKRLYHMFPKKLMKPLTPKQE